MYEAFYQLNAEPFRLSPDPAFSFQHRSYRKAMTYMLHALHRAEGFIMITGRPGTGKTTLINDLVRTLNPNQALVAKIVSTQLTADDLLNLVAYSFNLNVDGYSKAKVLVQVERFLKQQHHQGRRPLLIVDEAQDMGEDALEELRLLTNIMEGNHQLLQVFLVGQEQLRDTVNTKPLEQLHQRLIAATLLEPLNSEDTETYIKHRLRRVHWRGDPLISKEAYTMIQWYSHGIPRRINQICSRLFLHGCIEEKHRLGLADVNVVVEELRQELLLPAVNETDNSVLPTASQYREETCEQETYEEETYHYHEETPKEETPNQRVETDPAPQITDSLGDAASTAGSTETTLTDLTGEEGSTKSSQLAPPVTKARKQGEKPPAPPGSRELSAWKLMGLAGLFAGLLVMVTLFYTTQSPSNGGSAPRPGGVSESARADMDQSIADKYSRVPVETKAGLHRETALNDSATQRQLPDSSVIEKPTTAWEQSQPQKQLPTPEPVQAGLQEQQVTLSEISDLEEQIRQSGLLIERLAGGRLKVNLSSDGLFDFDSAEIKDKAQPALDGLAESLSGHDGLMVQIVGHTDSSGAAEYNLHLSRRRAGAVADYLIKRGFPGTSIQSEGRGDRDTRLDENTNTDPRLKRRVEIYITRIEAE